MHTFNYEFKLFEVAKLPLATNSYLRVSSCSVDWNGTLYGMYLLLGHS